MSRVIRSALASSFLVLSCAASAQALKADEVTALADVAAQERGYDLARYERADPQYRSGYGLSESNWLVFYQCRGRAPVGCHFGVVVNDKTREAKVHPGA